MPLQHLEELALDSQGRLLVAVERAIALATASGLLARSNGPSSSDVFSPSQPLNTSGDAAAPLLITEADSTRAIVLDSVTCKGEPFTSRSVIPWSGAADQQTRVSLFAMNIGPSFGDPDVASITVDAEDFAHNHYPLLVESVSEVPGYPGLNMVVVRLDESLGSVGDVLMSIHAHGKTSNRGRVGIGFVGAGLPDDSTPAPMGIESATLLVTPSVPTIAGFELHDAANNIYAVTSGTKLTLGSMPEPLEIVAYAGTTPASSVARKRCSTGSCSPSSRRLWSAASSSASPAGSGCMRSSAR